MSVKTALREALEDRGYDQLTPVQQAVQEPHLLGRDMLVSAQTGSGKTLGFGIAIAPTLLEEAEYFEQASSPLALVIAPTRELALQVKRELQWLYAKAGAHLASCVGGMDMRDERRALERGAHIVVATPGRLRDHISRGSIDLSNLRAVVLDEADEMLDLGFKDDLEFILGEAPEERQTLLFSATVPPMIVKLAQNYQKDAERIITKSETKQHADISYLAHQVSDRDVENAVINCLLFHKAPNAIVFGNTRATVNRLTTRLSNRGLKVVCLSGELTQSERSNALQAMRDGRANVCVATDVAARGIDLPNLDLVIHAELPSNHETMLHRSGRTGRAGRKGVSALLVTGKNRKKAERLLKFAKVQAEWANPPSAEDVIARDEERMFAEDSWTQDIQPSEESTVTKLVETFTAQQLAAAYLRERRRAGSTPEELSVFQDKPKERAPFGPSVWFKASWGRKDGAEPRRMLPMLCKDDVLTRDDIGAIRVKQTETFVQVKASSVEKLKSRGLKLEDGISLSEMDGPPPGEDGDRKPAPHRKGGSKPFEKRDDYNRKPKKPWDKEAVAPFKKERAEKKGDTTDRPRKPRSASKDKAPFGKTDDRGGKPFAGKKDGFKGKPKGPKPPMGKPGSKKNKARKPDGGKS